MTAAAAQPGEQTPGGGSSAALIARLTVALEDLHGAYHFLVANGPNSGSWDRWEAAKRRGRAYEYEPFRSQARQYVEDLTRPRGAAVSTQHPGGGSQETR